MIDIAIKTYMIVIKDNAASEYYASICIPSWEDVGFEVEIFDAITPDTIPDYALNFRASAAYKYRLLNIVKEFTATEKATFYSHLELWKKSVELDQPILVLEHDSYLVNKHLLTIQYDKQFVSYGIGMGCYIIHPEFATHLVTKLTKELIVVDSGPLGFLEDLAKRNKTKVQITRFKDIQSAACFPVYDPSYGSTIKHYEGTLPQSLKKHLTTTPVIIVKDKVVDNLTLVPYISE